MPYVAAIGLYFVPVLCLLGAGWSYVRWKNEEDEELALYTNEPRCLLMHTASLSPKTTRATQGVAVMTIKPKYHLERVVPVAETGITNPARYRTRTIPASGALVKPEDSDEKQITLL